MIGSLAALGGALLAMVWVTAPAEAALADGRVYEMVSPVDKNGGAVLLNPNRTRAAATGSAASFASLAGFGDVLGTGISADYMAVRKVDRWVTHGITPVQDPQPVAAIASGKDPIYVGEFSANLEKGVVRVNPSRVPLTPGAPNVTNVQNFYARNDLLAPGAGSYQLLTDSVNVLTTRNGYKPNLARASADFSHIAYVAGQNLTSDTVGLTPGAPKAYEAVNGRVRLAGILPDGTAAPSSVPGRGVGWPMSFALSTDGSRYLFTAPNDGSGTGNLYLRENGTTTVQLNTSEKVAPDAPQAARFESATPDASRVFFTSPEALTENASGCENLYSYDTTRPAGDPDNLRLLSVDAEPGDGDCASVVGVLGVSDDGSSVYFLTRNQIVAGAPLNPDALPLIYLWRNGTVRYIARLSEDQALGVTSAQANTGVTPDITPKAARVTTNGRVLLFTSYGSTELTGYDHGVCGNGTRPCIEMYIYDADGNRGAGALSCVSCNPSGAPATKDVLWTFGVNTGGANSTDHLPHLLSQDAKYVFFTTAETLASEDRNGVEDAYVYDVAARRASLLSTGTHPDGSYFLDASANGDDAFISTRERLSGWDIDSNYDLYDARVGGGLPEPPALLPACAGDSCQGPLTRAPDNPSPASATFSGPGDELELLRNVVPVFHTFDLRARALARWAATGIVTLRVRVSEAGRVGARVNARLNGTRAVVARAARDTRGGGVVRLPLKLSRRARRALADDGRLRLNMSVRYSEAFGVERTRLTLREAQGGNR